MRLRLDIDDETFQSLIQQAIAEKRPVDWQAEVTLRRALGLPFPPGVQPDKLATAGNGS